MCKGWRDLTKRLEEKGMQKGMQEGIQKGRQEGIQEGMQEGRQEGENNTMAVVILNAIRSKLSLETIRQITGFTFEKLQHFAIENGIDFPFEPTVMR